MWKPEDGMGVRKWTVFERKQSHKAEASSQIAGAISKALIGQFRVSIG